MSKTHVGIMLSLLLSNFVVFQSEGLSIDPFVTHNQLNQTIDAKYSFSFQFDTADLKRRLGFQLQSQSEEVLKVQILDDKYNPVNATIFYNFDEGVTHISSEFEPQSQYPYIVLVTNLDEKPIQVTGYYGIMLSVDEVNEIVQKYEGMEGLIQHYDPTSTILIIGFIGGGIGIIITFFLFRKKNKSRR